MTLPPDTEADVTVPTGRFEGAVVTADGRQVVGANPTVHVTAGTHQFVVTGTLKPALVARAADARTGKETTAADCDAFEVEVVKNDLIHSGSACRLVRVEEHCSHTGGGSNTSALLNGTTCNGEGSSETVDDGHTFRGYGAADYLVFHLDTAKSKAGYDLTRLLSFAGHSDARASQRYTVSFAFVSAPRHFVKFRPGAVECDGGGSIVRLAGKEGGILDNGEPVAVPQAWRRSASTSRTGPSASIATGSFASWARRRSEVVHRHELAASALACCVRRVCIVPATPSVA